MKDLLAKARELAETAAAEGRTLTDEERATVEQAVAGAKAVKADAELREAVAAMGEALAETEPEPKKDAPRTAGAKLLADPAFKAWRDGAAASGNPDPKSMSPSPSVSIGGLKATILGGDDSTGAGTLFQDDRYEPVTAAYARELTAVNLVTVGSTDSDVVEFARVRNLGSGSTNAAAPTAEGDLSPESTVQFEKTSVPVRDIRTFVPATTRALADAAQLQTIVNSFLSYSIAEEIEDQLINGDGSGENWTGLLNVSGTQAQPFDTDGVATIRKAIRRVRTGGNARPTAVLLNPEDNETLDLLSAPSTDYLFGGPAVAGTPTIWGLPRVECQALPAGTAIVADFRTVALWQRQAVTLAVYPQHSDFAIRGMVAFAATARAALGVLNPAAVCVVDMTSGS